MSKLSRTLTAVALSTVLAGGTVGITAASADAATANEGTTAGCLWIGPKKMGVGKKVRKTTIRYNHRTGAYKVHYRKGCLKSKHIKGNRGDL